MKMPMNGSKKVAPKASAAAKKPIRQIETSMSKKYKGTAKVSQTTIDNIKKLGMTAALKKAGSTKNPEYLEGIRRMYGAKRLAAAQGATKSTAKRAFSPAQKTAMGMGATKKAAAPAAKKSSSMTPAQAAEAKWRSADRYSNPSAKKKSTYKAPTPSAQQKAQGAARAGGSKTTYKPGAGR